MPLRANMWAATVAAAIFAGCVWWMLTSGEDEYLGRIGSGLILSGAVLFALVCCLRISRFFSGTVARSAWLFYALGAFLFLSARMYVALSLIFHGESIRMAGLPGVLILGQFVFFLIALRYMGRDFKPDNRIPLFRFYLDVSIISVGFVTLYWHYFLEPHMDVPIYRDADMLFSFVATAMGTSVLVGLLHLVLNGRMSENGRISGMLVLSFGLKTFACYMHLHLEVLGGSAWESQVADLIMVTAFLLLGLAAVLKEWDEMRRIGEERVSRRMPGISRYVPLIVFCALLAGFTYGIREPDMLMIGAVLVIHLLLMRLYVGKRASRLAERALSEAEEKYRNLVENSQVGVFSAQYGKLTYVNRYFAETFGYVPEEMVGTSFMHYFSTDDREKLAVEISRLAMNHGFTPSIGVQGIRRDGTNVHLEVQVTRTVQQGDVIITGTLLDITERKLAEEMVIRSEKLSVVGQLAAGVAHEIRNPLTSLRGFTQLLKARSAGDQNSEFYDIMLNELDRINYIVGEFMLLSRPQQMQQLDHHDMRELISSMLPIIETQAIIHNVTINMDWKTPLKPVVCDKNQIKQVFMNVLKNAIEAMPDGGTIRIRFSSHGGGYTSVQIVDEGPGMPAEVLSRLGEPFFTTKKTGTGLGLMVCYRIIEAHNGKMVIKSEKGKGTTVEIQLRTAADGWSHGLNI
jgi:PAS domain S-box-containing protein